MWRELELAAAALAGVRKRRLKPALQTKVAIITLTHQYSHGMMGVLGNDPWVEAGIPHQKTGANGEYSRVDL